MMMGRPLGDADDESEEEKETSLLLQNLAKMKLSEFNGGRPVATVA